MRREINLDDALAEKIRAEQAVDPRSASRAERTQIQSEHFTRHRHDGADRRGKTLDAVGRTATVHALHSFTSAELHSQTLRCAEVQHASARAGIEKEIERRRVTLDAHLQPDHTGAKGERNLRGRGGA